MNKLKRNARSYRYVKTPRGRIQTLLSLARWRTKKNGSEFDESLYFVFRDNPPSTCYCCGRLLDYRLGRGNKDRKFSPSLDRINNLGGYTLENTQVICFNCNRLK